MPRLKILLDECIDRRLAKSLAEHEVWTVPQRGWQGIKNGSLLEKAELEFDAFITVDSNLRFQQSITDRCLCIIILSSPSNRLQDLVRLTAMIGEAFLRCEDGNVLLVEQTGIRVAGDR